MFSTLESQGIRSEISWGIWTIHPDGANWGPLMSAFDPGGASNGFHFQTQLTDRSMELRDRVRAYFRNRDEDSNNADPRWAETMLAP